VNSEALPAFWAAYARLAEPHRRGARKAFSLWNENPFHPSLRFKCVNRDEDIWSVRISRGYRALGILENDTVTWFWVGSHDDYERFFS
jgi:hypothetical protein